MERPYEHDHSRVSDALMLNRFPLRREVQPRDQRIERRQQFVGRAVIQQRVIRQRDRSALFEILDLLIIALLRLLSAVSGRSARSASRA